MGTKLISHNQIERASWRVTARWGVNVVQIINIPLMFTAFLMGPGLAGEGKQTADSLTSQNNPIPPE